jgi:hypothetical protein
MRERLLAWLKSCLICLWHSVLSTRYEYSIRLQFYFLGEESGEEVEHFGRLDVGEKIAMFWKGRE